MQGVAQTDIDAARRWNDTGIALRADTAYRLSASGEWWDKDIRCGPYGYSTSGLSPLRRLIMWAARWRRRAQAEPWFALMGALDCDEATVFRIGSQRTYVPPRDGVLTCFANDLGSMYGNNQGVVTVTVTAVGT